MVYNIKDFGAVADGRTINTKAIQAAIDACHKNGGGRVLVEDGVYMFGTVVLKSNTDLHIAASATLLGSPRCEDYPERDDVKHVDTSKLPRWRNACYIYCEESENVSVTGMGKIDCNGTYFVDSGNNDTYWKYRRIDAPTPPRVLFFTGCKNVKFEDFTVVNQPAGWCAWIHDCDYVTCDKLKINSSVEFPNNDGIHVNSSRNVCISNCSVTCGDDCIVIRANNSSLKENKVCEKVTVTNCNLTSYSSGIRIGWENDGTIRNCTFSGIVMTDTSRGVDITLPYHPARETGSYADLGREATLIENLSFDNIIMDGVYGEPVKIWFTDNEETRIEAVRNIYFSNLHVRGPRGINLVGRANKPIDNVRFSNCTFEMTDYSYFGGRAVHGTQNASDSHGGYPNLKNCDRVTFDCVEFRNLRR